MDYSSISNSFQLMFIDAHRFWSRSRHSKILIFFDLRSCPLPRETFSLSHESFVQPIKSSYRFIVRLLYNDTVSTPKLL